MDRQSKIFPAASLSPQTRRPREQVAQRTLALQVVEEHRTDARAVAGEQHVVPIRTIAGVGHLRASYTGVAPVLPLKAHLMASIEQTTISKVSWRLLPLLMVSYFIAYLDRVNLGFAGAS